MKWTRTEANGQSEPPRLRASLEFGVNRKGSLGDQSSMISAGCSQKKRKAVVRWTFAATQEYESWQQNDRWTDMWAWRS